MLCSDLVAYYEMWNIPLKQQPQTKKGQKMSNKHERELAGKVALVTGGLQGHGAAIPQRLGAGRARGAVTYFQRGDAPASVVETVARAGGQAGAVPGGAAGHGAVRD